MIDEDPVAVTRATYDVVAEEFMRRTSAPYLDLADDVAWIVGQLPPGGLVADVGCGPGRDLRALREKGAAAVGVDLSMGMLRAGGLPGVAQGDMRHLPLANGALAAVWCNAALLHVPRPDVPAVVNELSRVLREGGAMHLAVSEGDGEGFEGGHYGSEHQRFFVHHRLEGLAPLLVEAGFAVAKVSRHIANRPWLRIRARKR